MLKASDWEVLYFLSTAYWLGDVVATTDVAVVSGMSESSARRCILRLADLSIIHVNQDRVDRRRRILTPSTAIVAFLEEFVANCSRDFSEIISFHESKARDDAERKLLRSETQRLTREAQLRATDTIGDVGHWSRSLLSGEVHWSDATYRIFGFQPGEVTPSRELVRSMVHPDDFEAYVASMDRVLSQNVDHGRVYRIVRRDGSTRWIRGAASVMFDSKRQPTIISGALRDVSDAIEMEEALRASEQRFRDFTETASDWVWETNVDHEFTFVSERFFAVFGIPRSAIMGRTRTQVAGRETLSEDAKAWAAHHADLAARRPFRDFRYSVTTRDETKLHLCISGKPVFDVDGAFIGYRGTGRDVSMDVANADALSASEARFRDYTGTASDWVWESGPDHRISFVSGRIEGIAGRRPDEFIGRTGQEMAGEESVAAAPEAWAAHSNDLDMHRPFKDFVFQSRNPDGKIAYFSASGKPIFDAGGAFLGHRGTGRDITDRVGAEQALKESEARWRTLLDQQSDMIVFYEPSLFRRFANAAYCSFVGRDASELTDEMAGAILEKADAERLRATLTSLNAVKPTASGEYPMTRHDGEVRWVQWHHRAVISDTNDVVGMICSGRDITDQHTDKRRLADAKKDAEIASRQKSAFMATMSHDIRTPLNAIIGFSQLIQSEIAGPLGAKKYYEYLDHITDAGDYLLALVNNVLDLARIESGEFELDEEEVDIRELVGFVCRNAMPSAEDAGVLLKVIGEPWDGRFVVDRTRLTQMVSNLVSNGIKFCRAGGEVSIQCQEGENGGGVISVRDNGIGIEPDSIQSVFDPFAQGQMDVAKKSQGVGLGLAIVKSLAELHGASVGISSELGKGTSVHINLPAERRVV
ncbi:MAG: PAS domain S-box protein [Rhodospirillaceae bacterium]|jgi:PAS domain S-box-containing protein|nr:PAS domain S-box protein [Rhodospirillaceae bacterium]